MSILPLSRIPLIFILSMAGFLAFSQANAASCSSNCLSIYHVSVTDLGTSLRGTVKVADEFFSAGAARGAVVQGMWTRQDGSTFLQSRRIGTRLRADFSFGHGGVPGTYTFEVIDVTKTGYSFDAAASVELSASVIVQSSNNQPPVAIINTDLQRGDAPLAINFDALSSFDSDGEVAAYSWNFGDGALSVDPAPTHVYMDSGIYTATLNVLDNNGARASSSVSIQVDEVQSVNATGCQTQCLSLDEFKMSIKNGKVVGKIRVMDENGETVQDATIEALWTLPDGTEVLQTKQNKSRKLTVFRIPLSQSGVYTLSVSGVTKVGYQYLQDGNKVDFGSISVD